MKEIILFILIVMAIKASVLVFVFFKIKWDIADIEHRSKERSDGRQGEDGILRTPVSLSSDGDPWQNRFAAQEAMRQSQSAAEKAMRQNQFAAEERLKSVTPFEMGGYDMTQAIPSTMSSTPDLTAAEVSIISEALTALEEVVSASE